MFISLRWKGSLEVIKWYCKVRLGWNVLLIGVNDIFIFVRYNISGYMVRDR